jgi:hypothetical protein
MYLALIIVYIVSMQRADRNLQRAFEADAHTAADTGAASGAGVAASPTAADAADAGVRGNLIR